MNENSVLIIESDPIVRDSLCEWLKSTGFDVTSAENGEGIVKIVESANLTLLSWMSGCMAKLNWRH
jgi:CheY-like chemotaxis protein